MSADRRDFLKLIADVEQRAELEPNNAEAQYAVAAYYWDEASRNGSLTGVQRREYVLNGITAVDKAIVLNPDYVDALVQRGLLLRMEAAAETDADRQKALLNEAAAVQEKAHGLKRSG